MPEIRQPTQGEYDAIFDLTRQAFNAPSEARERGRADFEPENHFVVEHDGRLVATLRTLPFAQFWGGRSIRSVGIAGVAVAPDARGKRHGTSLTTEALRALRADGVLISTLYPATVPIYHALGYGYGGIRSQWKADLRALPTRADATVEPFAEGEFDDVADCYTRFARTGHGLIDRTPAWWQRRVLRSAWEKDEPYRYLVRENGRVTGYVIYRLQKGNADEWRATLACRDLIWTTPGAARALLAMAAMHRSTGARIMWAGPPVESIADLLPEDDVELDFRFRWMLRLLDVPGAIEARGYPRGLETSVTIRARDPLFGDNEGPWRVEVSGGAAKAAPADTGEAEADVQTWATIWAGLQPASQMVRLGALEASEDAVAKLDAIFSGPAPWLADFF